MFATKVRKLNLKIDTFATKARIEKSKTEMLIFS